MNRSIKEYKYLWLSMIVITIISCGDLLVGPDPDNTPENNFEILWQDFDRYYSFFEHKQIDWDSLYTVYRPQVSEKTTEKELFEIISSMVENLQDGHVNIYSTYGQYMYKGWWEPYPIFFNLNTVKTRYLENDFKQSGNRNITYANISPNTGYIHIASFGSQFGIGHFELIDNILEEFKDCTSIIIDVRNNGGGSTSNTEVIAGRFADQRKLFAYYQYRNGAEHDDFTELIPWYIDSSGEKQFTKPVVILTNRKCFSATETFILQMREFPHVTVVGDTSGGGSGNPMFRELPNGWTYRLSRWQEFTPDLFNYEGIGLFPDIPVQNSEADSTAGIDTQLEKAMEFLNQQSIG